MNRVRVTAAGCLLWIVTWSAIGSANPLDDLRKKLGGGNKNNPPASTAPKNGSPGQGSSPPVSAAAPPAAQGDPVPVTPKKRNVPPRFDFLGVQIGMSPEEVAGVAQQSGYSIEYQKKGATLVGAALRFEKGAEVNFLTVLFTPPPMRVVQMRRNSSYRNNIMASDLHAGILAKFGDAPLKTTSGGGGQWAWDSSGNPAPRMAPDVLRKTGGCGWDGYVWPNKGMGFHIDTNVAQAFNDRMKPTGWASCAVAGISSSSAGEGLANAFTMLVVDIATIETINDQLLAEAANAAAAQQQETVQKASETKATF